MWTRATSYAANRSAVFGTLGSVAALGGAAVAKRVHDSRRKLPDTEIERVIERLGGGPSSG